MATEVKKNLVMRVEEEYQKLQSLKCIFYELRITFI